MNNVIDNKQSGITQERLEIIGGKALNGSVKVSGAKNAVLKLMPAALLANNRSIIRNVPRIRDVEIMIGVIQGLGADVVWDDETTIIIEKY